VDRRLIVEAENSTFTVSVPGDGAPHLLVTAVKVKTEVVITCGFGAAVVEVSMRENGPDSTWVPLPGVSTWTKKLKVGEMLFVRSDLATRVPVALGEP